MRYLTQIFLTKTDLYHIDISPATALVADHKIRGMFGVYAQIPMYSWALTRYHRNATGRWHIDHFASA